MTSPFGGSLVSDISYDPFLMVICSYDAEWTRYRPEVGHPWFDAFTRTMSEYAEGCRTYGRNVNRNYKQFCKANGIAAEETLKSPYFDPVFYLPLGHADVMSLTILDDFDPLHFLTGRVPTAIEDTTLAFCPNPRSIGAQQGEMLFPDIPALWHTLKSSVTSQIPRLLLFCKLKMDGLSSLGLAYPCQAATWKAMVKRIRSVMEALRRNALSYAEFNQVGSVRPEDLESLRCMCLDLQGCEEIGLLVFSSDFCAAACILRGLLGLTYGDLFTEAPFLAKQLGRSRVHRRIAAFNHSDGREEIPGDELKRAIYGHHILRWTCSSVAVFPATALGDSERLYCKGSSCRGYVRANTKMRISPGHLGQANRIIHPTDGMVTDTPVRAELDESACPEGLLIGSYDASFEHHVSSLARTGGPLLPIGEVVDNLERTLKELSGEREYQEGRPCRSVVDLETEITVPIPRLIDTDGRCLTYGDSREPHGSPLEQLLPLVNDQLFCRRSGKTTRANVPERTGRENGWCQPNGLDIKTLMDAQRNLGIPVSLRREIECLYQDYAVYLADPFSFDVVLDLYDAFATLHAILVEHLQEVHLGRFEATGREGRRLLDESRVNSLAEFVDALHDALVHRTGKIFPNAPNRDMAVDIRGGLNQILHATDTTLKCGLGILRRFSSPTEKPRGRDTVGCVIRLGKMPGARCCIAGLGAERWGRLAFFDMDAPHILHVASCADYLHEAFHLVFRESIERDQHLADAVSKIEQEPTRDRVEEIFSLMLWKLFIFGTDTNSFLSHSVLSYSRSIASVGVDDSDTCRRFTEMLTRLFLAVYGMEEATLPDPRFWPLDYPAGILEDTKTAVRRFSSVLRTAGPFFSEYRRLWKDDAKRRALDVSMAHFGCVFVEIKLYLPLLRGMALSIYRRAMKSLLPGDDLQLVHQMVACIDTDVRRGLREGRPLVWSQYKRVPGAPVPKGMFASAGNFDGDGLDALPLACRMFYQYISAIRKAKGKEIHLPRSSGQAKLSYKGHENWYDFQADKGAAALFCPVPSARQTRLRKQIVILKSFWDIASEFRARRLLDILLSNAIVPPKRR